MADGIVVRRPLGQDRQIGELREIELVELLVEIGVARRLDTECVAAECDLVEVEFENLRLGQRILDLIGEDRLLQLARRPVPNFCA
jgi:hypothetical protein